MAGPLSPHPTQYRIPPGVAFLRWLGDGEWVIYHSGTGATLRLTDAAVTLLDTLAQAGPLDREAIVAAMNALMDIPLSDADMHTAADALLRTLLQHECIEQVSCG